MVDWASHIRVILYNLGEDATFTHGTGAPVPVRGLFLAPYQIADLGAGSVTASNPAFVAMTADMPGVTVDDLIQRAAGSFKVKVKQPDDPAGFTVLELKKA